MCHNMLSKLGNLINVEDNESVDINYLDYELAFTVSHQKLGVKLEVKGMVGNVLPSIQNFLL